MKRGRKKIPKAKQKRNITICLSSSIIDSLKKDAKKGKAVTLNRMAAKIVNKYYKKIKEKEKNKVKEENMTDKKAA